MKGKLIKVEKDYYTLYDSDGDIVASNNPKTPTTKKLSFKNCEAIVNGYDFDEYQEGVFYAGNFGHPSPEGFSEEQVGRLHGFIDGFQKALEILGDKKFSIDDIQNIIDSNEDSLIYQTVNEDGDISFCLDEDVLIQSLQKTEWDVEIETIEYGLGNDENGRPVFETRNILDADGCLILRRI